MNYSDFLIARPSTIEGVSRILDFGNTLNEYNNSLSVEMADHIALSLDWEAVGHHLRNALRNYVEEIQTPEKSK